METQELITLEQLTAYGVNVKKEIFVENNILIKTERISYINSDDGRLKVQNDLPQPQVNAILAIWDS